MGQIRPLPARRKSLLSTESEPLLEPVTDDHTSPSLVSLRRTGPLLPHDLLLLIASQLVFNEGSLRPTDSTSLLSCALVCKTWSESFLPLLYRNSVVPLSKLWNFVARLKVRGGAELKTLVVTEVPLHDDLRLTKRVISDIYASFVGDPSLGLDCLAPNVRLILLLSGPLTHPFATHLRESKHSKMPVLSFGTRSAVKGGQFQILPMQLGKLVSREFRTRLSRRNLVYKAVELLCFGVAFGLASLGIALALGVFLSEEPVEDGELLTMGLSFAGAAIGLYCHQKLLELHEPVVRTLQELDEP